MGDSLENLYLYIPDDIVQRAEQDAFGHSQVADAILQSILNTSPPFIIGVFGGWGTGKSSILNLIGAELDNHNVPTANIDAWQYSSAQDLKRAFLVRIARVLAPDLLDELRARLFSTEQEKVPPRPSSAEESRWTKIRKGARRLIEYLFRVFFAFLLYSLLFFGLLALIIAIRSALSDDPAYDFSFVAVINTFIDLAFVPFAVALVSQLSPLITQEPIVVRHERIDADELFAEYFNKVVNQAVSRCLGKDRQLVIFVDNLDRLSDDKMVLALEALKTYLGNRQCIFVVACDDHVVRSVVERSDLVPTVDEDKKEGAYQRQRLGEDYLDKFFQQTFRLPAYMEVDLSDFAEIQFSQTQLHALLKGQDFNAGYLVSTILPSDTTSPRKVKRLLNEFIATYEIARRLEDDDIGKLQPGVLTGDPVFLGKFSTLRAEYPDFYSQLVASPSLLRKISREIRSLNDKAAISMLSAPASTAKLESLIAYLRKTLHVDVADIDPYVWLSQDATMTELPSEIAEDLRIALSDGDHKKVVAMLDAAEDDQERELVARAASRYVGMRLRGLNQQNGTLVLCRILDQVSPAVQGEVAQVAANAIPIFPLHVFGTAEILSVLQKAGRSEKRDLVDALLKRLDEPDLRQDTFEGILDFSDVIEEAEATPLVHNWLGSQLTPDEAPSS